MQMKEVYYLSFFLFLLFSCDKGDEPEETSPPAGAVERYFQAGEDARAFSLTIEDGFVYAFGTTSNGVESDFYLVITDLDGNLVIDKIFENPGLQQGISIVRAANGDFFLYGTTRPNNSSPKDLILLRIDQSCNVIWQNTYGGADGELAGNLLETFEGKICLAGGTSSQGNGGNDMYLIWLDQSGVVLSERTYGTSFSDGIVDLLESENGALMVFGYSQSEDGSNRDFCLMNVAQDGDSLWGYRYGGKGYEESQGFARLTSGDYVMAGHSASTEPNHNMYAVCVDSEGNLKWEREFGGSLHDGAQGVVAYNNTCAVLGRSVSFGDGNRQILLANTDAEGNTLNETLYGGQLNDFGQDIEAHNGYYYIVGHSSSRSLVGEELYWLRVPVN